MQIDSYCFFCYPAFEMRFTLEQYDKLSDLFIDLAKGMFLAGLAAPAISKQPEFISSLKSMILALAFTYFSLKILELKEVKK